MGVQYKEPCPTCGGPAIITGDDSEGNTLYEHDREDHLIVKVLVEWNDEEQKHNYVFVHSPDCPPCLEQ